ncbi:MAG TPA: hypothetical protein VFA33_26965 [Bryobacteraceae bacterium]|nr:hypothetical protein [Bryobacteraceae bacterium]
MFAILFALAGALVLPRKLPADRPTSGPLFRLDNRVVAALLFLLAGCFAVLHFAGGAAQG